MLSDFHRVIVLTVAAFCIGCGGKGEELPKVFPVSGVVTFNGKPIEGAFVTFSPNDKNVRTAAGQTDAEGKFKLTTFKIGDGCTPGRMTVTIAKIESPTEPDPKTGKIPPMRSHLPIRYSERENSGLEATVEAKPENHFEFKLEK